MSWKPTGSYRSIPSFWCDLFLAKQIMLGTRWTKSSYLPQLLSERSLPWLLRKPRRTMAQTSRNTLCCSSLPTVSSLVCFPSPPLPHNFLEEIRFFFNVSFRGWNIQVYWRHHKPVDQGIESSSFDCDCRRWQRRFRSDERVGGEGETSFLQWKNGQARNSAICSLQGVQRPHPCWTRYMIVVSFLH